MKIKVTPEGRKDIFIADKEGLKAWIKDKGFKKIHNFVGGGSMFIGADHPVKSVLEDIDKAERIGLLANSMSNANMGHALSLIIDNKLECYDIGKITDEDLEIVKEKNEN